MALSSGVVISIVGIVIGIILLIIGIVFFEINRSNNKAQPWWVWFLMIGGAVIAVAFGIFLGFTLWKGNKREDVSMQKMGCPCPT